jgi:hypothetical protein
MIAALVRTVFAQPDADRARLQLRAVVDQLTPYAPAVAERLEAMEADVLAYTGFPSRALVEDLVEQPDRNDSTGNSSDAPTSSGSSRQGSGDPPRRRLLVEINDEMIAAERRYIAAASVAELTDSTAS